MRTTLDNSDMYIYVYRFISIWKNIYKNLQFVQWGIIGLSSMWQQLEANTTVTTRHCLECTDAWPRQHGTLPSRPTRRYPAQNLIHSTWPRLTRTGLNRRKEVEKHECAIKGIWKVLNELDDDNNKGWPLSVEVAQPVANNYVQQHLALESKSPEQCACWSSWRTAVLESILLVWLYNTDVSRARVWYSVMP